VDTLVGTRIGDFIVRERVGTGGMGVVYRGEHPLIGASVALKVLRPEAAGDPEQVQRLQDEARLVNAIRHRGIVGIFNYFTLPAPDGRHCLMMEFLKGRSLEQELARRGGRLPLVEALGLYEQVCAALAAAHKAGVVHRDLKPSNIFLVEEHDQMYVKVLDFGIAKQSAVPYGFVAQTMVTRFMGTPGFVAPEQARAQPVGPGTDLYALGVCLFITLTGQTPSRALPRGGSRPHPVQRAAGPAAGGGPAHPLAHGEGPAEPPVRGRRGAPGAGVHPAGRERRRPRQSAGHPHRRHPHGR